MQVNHVDSGEPIAGSIFLAGPTPRSSDVKSWRPEAIEFFASLDFDGVLSVPERHDWAPVKTEGQIDWELRSLESARVIMFWVPRNMKTMPALTTNVEFGYFIAKRAKNIVYGRPDDADHIGYLDWMYQNDCLREPKKDLLNTVAMAVYHHGRLRDRWR